MSTSSGIGCSEGLFAGGMFARLVKPEGSTSRDAPKEGDFREIPK